MRVSVELLAKRLGLKADVQIIGALVDGEDLAGGTITLALSGPDLPLAGEGCVATYVDVPLAGAE